MTITKTFHYCSVTKNYIIANNSVNTSWPVRMVDANQSTDIDEKSSDRTANKKNANEKPSNNK
jgi:hypothetical protein